jgi:HK97 family phage major capsid protein/HK97 family phage prohead protease
MTDAIKVGRLSRDMFGAEVTVQRAKDEPIRLSFPASSEMPVERWFGTEVLRHDDKSIRMDRLKGGAAPLLFNHDWGDPVGMVDSARIKDKRLWVDAHFFDTERAREVAAMVEGGMRNVSIGYELYEMVEDTKAKSFTATDWGVLEVSFATVPADPGVGVGRSNEDTEAKPVRVTRMEEPAQVSQAAAPQHERKTMTVEAQAAAGANADTQAQGEQRQATMHVEVRTSERSVEFERNRRRGIENICKANKIDDNLRDYWIGTGLTIEQLSDDLLKVLEERGKTNPKTDTSIGLTEKEARSFSLFNAIRAVVDKNWSNAGFELEASRAVAQKLGRMSDAHKFFVPFEVQQSRAQGRRDLTAGTSSAGGYLVSTENMSFIELMRNRSVVYNMGARRLAGLVGNVTVPKQSAAGTAVWLANEASTVTESAQTFGQMSLSPKTVGGYTEISRQLLLQSSPDAEGIVKTDLATICALAIDVGALRGSGASGEPQGIVGTSGVGSVTGTSLAAAGILEFQSDVSAGNLLSGSCGYVTTPAVAALLMARPELPSTGTTRLWQGNMLEGTLFNMRAMTSNQMSSATMLFGDFSQVVIGEWGVLEIEVNPYANFQAGIVGVRALVSIDVGVRYGGAFSYASSIT